MQNFNIFYILHAFTFNFDDGRASNAIVDMKNANKVVISQKDVIDFPDALSADISCEYKKNYEYIHTHMHTHLLKYSKSKNRKNKKNFHSIVI